jgi:hypothetical protein
VMVLGGNPRLLGWIQWKSGSTPARLRQEVGDAANSGTRSSARQRRRKARPRRLLGQPTRERAVGGNGLLGSAAQNKEGEGQEEAGRRGVGLQVTRPRR